MMLMKSQVVLVGCLLGVVTPVFAQKSAAGWPDNIIITKKLMVQSELGNEPKTALESSAPYICARLGRSYQPGAMVNIWETAVVTEEVTYLSGRQSMVVKQGFALSPERDAGSLCSVDIIVPHVSYEYRAPGAHWTAQRIGSKVHVSNPSVPSSAKSLLVATAERQFQQRLGNFHGKWRRQQYDNIETRFGHRCGYPIDPMRSEALKNLPADFMATAKELHEGMKSIGLHCSLLESPHHVGTGHLLVLHVKKPAINYDENTGCSEFAGDLLFKQRCEPIVTDFKVNASMPKGVFEMPDWARGQVAGRKTP